MKETRAQKARVRLRAAIDACCVARGEAQWTNGYRAGSGDTDKRLYDKEQGQWRHVGDVEQRLERFITAYGRISRTEKRA